MLRHVNHRRVTAATLFACLSLTPAASRAATEYQFVAPDSVSGSSFDHNGSQMRVDPDLGIIIYQEPKASIADVVKPGAVLFRGKVRFAGSVSGTAYAFKKGCPPASYAVKGSFNRDSSAFTVRGPGPVRDGCAVTHLSASSPHSTLTFKSLMSP